MVKFMATTLWLIALQALLVVYAKEGTIRGLRDYCPVSAPFPTRDSALPCRLPPGEDSLTCNYSYVETAESKPNGSCTNETSCVPTQTCFCEENGYWSCIDIMLGICLNEPYKRQYANVGYPCAP
eukprot:CAMPEP_0117020624 /NCGR_PEP_ID=MMETSP0472-20121206/15656_1 /TAXON_ID=693140 ORGANISM="Tiarina fusus, Strain LIS" /NCGR_SAMPLE_ID=MMETSP0472 /ASSEMBLY_ACC=CAM_ASM_000603 /LENGTH=124 /DNA_ID=CAMNT_0004725883 /DNA_START=53 /DNA_END=427 /DNA_ORIENTATION=+